jgi:hypothetical protein
MNDETRRTKSINRWKSCLFNITTHTEQTTAASSKKQTQSNENAMCARNQLSLSINVVIRQKHTDWLPHCNGMVSTDTFRFSLSFFVCFHQGWLKTPDGRAATCAIGNWIHTVSFEQFSKPFYRMFQFYSILAMHNIIRSTSLEERDDHHYSANETSKQDSSLDRNNGRCLVSNMKRYDDESSEHT